MSKPPVVWQTPRPLWMRFGSAAADQARPVILRFVGDDFMEQLLTTLARDPSGLDALIARPETWRAPARTPAPLVEQTPIPTTARTAVRKALAQLPKAGVSATNSQANLTELGQTQAKPLKLFQPVHHRFYIVGASLSCAVPGLPERPVAPGGPEEVNFVLRRLLPNPTSSTDPADLREFAYVKDAQGARWQRVDAGTSEARYVPGEERLPVFPLPYQDDAGKPRTLWAGLVPVGRREDYIAAKVERSVAPAFRAGQLLAVRDRSGNGAASAAAVSSGTTSSNGSKDATRKKQARVVDFQLTVAEPWKNLIRSSYKLRDSLIVTVEGTEESESSDKKKARVFDHNLQQQNTSWLILLDFADYLTAYLPDVWQAIERESAAGILAANSDKSKLYDRLGEITPGTPAPVLTDPATGHQYRPPASSLRDALKAIRAAGVRESLEATKYTYTKETIVLSPDPWPTFHFVLAGLDYGWAVGAAWKPVGAFRALTALADSSDENIAVAPVAAAPGMQEAEASAVTVDRLTTLVGRALDVTTQTDAPPIPFAAQLRDALRDTVSDPGWFAVRFVYTRRDCGPLAEPELSVRSQRFQIASFYDSDAPARPIRITLPVDTSPAGLRKFNKNTAFVLSDMLCGQVQRAKGLGFVDLVLAVLPWPFHKGLDVGKGGPCQSAGMDIGMICSLSIPIITICALILLIIMVSLFDFIFRWLPYFIMCFPLPKFSGKKVTS